ncbi:proline-rich protein 5-like [Aplochiton taeniatus]
MEGGSFRRLKRDVSSPSLGDPQGKTDKSSLAEESKGTQQRRAGANATWNSIHNAVVAVFQRKDLAENELYVLNEGVRQLLKTELGSFFTEYLQNQLLTKGMVILRDKIRFYEGQKLLDSLAETWDFFFCNVLSMLQAIFYPVQGKEPSVRQLALLHFRNIITLNIKLEEALSRPRARVPPSIIQMLLILQGVHESKGLTEDYLHLEVLIQKVVSPYLGTHGLFSGDDTNIHYPSCVLEKRLQRRWPRPNDHLAKNPVVRSKSYNVPMLTPVVEHDPDAASAGSGGIRRHSVCEMTSCLEEGSMPDPTDPTVTSDMSSSSSSSQAFTASEAQPEALSLGGEPSLSSAFASCSPHLQLQHHSPSILPEFASEDYLLPGESPVSGSPSLELLRRADQASKPSLASSLELIGEPVLESADSSGPELDGIFIEFPQRCSEGSSYSRDSGRHSVV